MHQEEPLSDPGPAVPPTPNDADTGMTGAFFCRPGYRFVSYDRFQDIPFEAANAMLCDHVRLMLERTVGSGGPWFDYMDHVNGFWAKIGQALPPNGRYYLVWSDAGDLVGTGALRRLSDDVGEMKHLYVRPEARRAGLGRALVLRRMADARAMGLKTLVADTIAANIEMPALYESLGFKRVAPFEISGTAGISPQLVDFMLFFRKAL